MWVRIPPWTPTLELVFLVYTGDMVPVIDVSYWQGEIDFNVMQDAGVQGVYIRAGRGVEADTNFEYNVDKAKTARLKIGAYWFLNPTSSADPKVPDRMLAVAHKSNDLWLPPMMDVEWYKAIGPYPELSGEAYASWLRTFSNTVKRNARRPIIYTNVNYWNPNVGSSSFGDHQLILSKWITSTEVPSPENWDDFAATTSSPVIPMGWTAWNMWQFSAQGNAQGVKYGASSVDLDLNIATDTTWASWVAYTRNK